MSPTANYDLSWRQLWRMVKYLNPDTRLHLVSLARQGLADQDPQHKQWCLAQILFVLGEDTETIDQGIAPKETI